MTPEQKLDQDYQAILAALRDEKNQQISDYQAQAWKMAQRASKAEAERDALQVRVDGALVVLCAGQWDMMARAIKILTGEGE